jgi:hypothetical protein
MSFTQLRRLSDSSFGGRILAQVSAKSAPVRAL